jgi:hypothetical protein
MRLKLILPVVEAEKHLQPEECPYGCGRKEFFLRQQPLTSSKNCSISFSVKSHFWAGHVSVTIPFGMASFSFPLSDGRRKSPCLFLPAGYSGLSVFNLAL